ncbi:MAG: hypothetical protein ACI808_002262 [Paraglaciecola sp.]|jgi:hypothetical protein
MSLLQENFNIAAELAENSAVRIQATLRMLKDNTQTEIKLKDPVAGGTSVAFDLLNGSLDDVDRACGYNSVNRNNYTLLAE